MLTLDIEHFVNQGCPTNCCHLIILLRYDIALFQNQHGNMCNSYRPNLDKISSTNLREMHGTCSTMYSIYLKCTILEDCMLSRYVYTMLPKWRPRTSIPPSSDENHNVIMDLFSITKGSANCTMYAHKKGTFPWTIEHLEHLLQRWHSGNTSLSTR